MNKAILKIDGMACPMCESHVADAIRKTYCDAKEVKVSHIKKEASFVIDKEIDLSLVKEAINKTGYKYIDGKIEPYERKKLFGIF
ncbi:MAG: heavy-metal-associated domain-containing protein [Lachnospiraceae bacterium]|nr:heavy-metal-associated domain-containing protein [Lachnospiraceae bacterium]